MSRAAIFYALTHDATLTTLGINANTVFPNYSLDKRPVDNGAFLILRWAEDGSPVFGDVKPPRGLDIWAHYPSKKSSDHAHIDTILDACDSVLTNMYDVAGSDGYKVTCVRAKGRSRDLKDESFETITRFATYDVLARKG